MDTTYFFPKGIDQLEIEESPRKYNGMSTTAYVLRIRLNLTRAIGDNGYGIMPLTSGNLKKAASSINKVLRNTLQLNSQNNRLEEWTVTRLDTAFDVFVECPEVLVFLLNVSLRLPKGKYRVRDPPENAEERKKWMAESVWFASDSHNYNVYAKLRELENKIERKRKRCETVEPLTDKECAELKHLLRVERQNMKKALKKLLPDSGKFRELFQKKTMARIQRTMMDDIQNFWGTGDFYSAQKAMEIFNATRTDMSGIYRELNRIYHCCHDCSRGDCSQETSSILEDLGIARAFLTERMSQVFQTDRVQGLYSTIATAYPRPAETRAYGKFPSPHKCADGRYKANLSLPVAGEPRSVQKTICGRDLEAYEKKVLEALNDVITGNVQKIASDPSNEEYRLMFEKSVDYRERFLKAAKSSYIKAIRKARPKQSPDAAASGSGFEVQSLYDCCNRKKEINMKEEDNDE